MTHLIVPWILFVTIVAFFAWWILKPNPNRARQADPKVIFAQASVVLLAVGMLYWQSAFRGSSIQGDSISVEQDPTAIEGDSTTMGSTFGASDDCICEPPTPSSSGTHGAFLDSRPYNANKSFVNIDSSGNPHDYGFFLIGLTSYLNRYVLRFDSSEDSVPEQNVAQRTLLLPFAPSPGVDIYVGGINDEFLNARIRVHRLDGPSSEFVPGYATWNHRDKQNYLPWVGGAGAEGVSTQYADSQTIGDIIDGLFDDLTVYETLEKIVQGEITAHDVNPIEIDITDLEPHSNQVVALRLSVVDADGYESDSVPLSSKFIVLGSAYNPNPNFRPSLITEAY